MSPYDSWMDLAGVILLSYLFVAGIVQTATWLDRASDWLAAEITFRRAVRPSEPGKRINPEFIKVMREHGVDEGIIERAERWNSGYVSRDEVLDES